MERLTFWNARNPIKARISLVMIHLLMTCIAMLLGAILFISDVELSSWLNYVLLGIFSFSLLAYPFKNGKEHFFKYDFKKRRRSDFSMTLTFGFIIAVSFNQFLYAPTNLNVSPTSSATSMLIVNKGKSGIEKSKKVKRKTWKQTKRAFKKQIKSQVKNMKKRFKKNPDKSNNGAKGMAIFGTVLLMIILAFLVAAGSCVLACNGYTILSLLLLFGGITGIVFMAVGLFRAIHRKFQKGPKSPVEGNSTS